MPLPLNSMLWHFQILRFIYKTNVHSLTLRGFFMNQIKKTIVFLSILFTLFTFPVTATPDYVTPLKDNVTSVMNDYNLGGQNNSIQLAYEIGENVSSAYGWNCDILKITFKDHQPVYINTFYPASDNQKGYLAYYGWFGPQKKEVTVFWGKDHNMYYKTWGTEGKAGCRIPCVVKYEIVKSYFGNNTQQETNGSYNPAQVLNNTTEGNNSSSSVVTGGHVIVNSVKETINGTMDSVSVAQGNQMIVSSINSTISEVNNTNGTINTQQGNQMIMNSLGTADNRTVNNVQNQGVIESIKQYFIDLSNTNWSNVTFNFWG